MRVHSLIAASCAALLLATATASVAGPPAHANARGHAHSAQQQQDWEYRGVKVHDNQIKQYTWEIAVAPYGPYDKIAVHRFVREPNNGNAIPGRPAPDKRKVLFGISGTWGQGGPKKLIEEYDPHFFATHGYDYWTMDFRTSYVPNLAYHQFEEHGELEGLKSTANWTYEAFREDIKFAVELTKKISRADRVFMSGKSRGGTQLYIYAAKYADDLKGMIGLDGGPIYRRSSNPEVQRTQEQFEQGMAEFREGLHGPLLSEVSNFEGGQFGGAVPYAEADVGRPLPSAHELPFGPPPDGSQIRTMTDLAAYDTYYVWGQGMVSNVYGAHPSGGTYMEKDRLVLGRAGYTRYWPAVQNFETGFMNGYANTPFLDYDNTEHVTVPVIHFAGEFACPGGGCLDSNGRQYSTGTSDVTVVYLEGYGHVDVYYGTHSNEEVKRPMLEWMNARL